jgi:hypothetical protein
VVVASQHVVDEGPRRSEEIGCDPAGGFTRAAVDTYDGSTKPGKPGRESAPHPLHSAYVSCTGPNTSRNVPAEPGTSYETDGLGRKVMPEPENRRK